MVLPSYPYNLTKVTDVVDVSTFLSFANNLTSGYFGWLTIVAVFIITFIFSNKYGTGDAFIAASFISFVISIFLNLFGAVDGTAVLMTLLCLGIGVAFANALKG